MHVLHGAEDEMAPPADAELYADAIARPRVHVY